MNWIFQTGAPNSKAALANPALRQALVENGLRIRQHADSLPVRLGTTPLRVVPEYEAWLVEAMQQRTGVSLLAHQGNVGRRSCERLRRRSGHSHHRLVRLVDPSGHDELRGPVEGQEVASAARDRPLDPRRAGCRTSPARSSSRPTPPSTSSPFASAGTTAG